jgi:hypothetical protein
MAISQSEGNDMDLEAVCEALHRQPSRSFTISLADGRRLVVARPDSIAVGRQRAFVIGPDDSCASIEPSLITSLDDISEHAPRSTQRIRQLYDATPFKPFTIHLADGRQIAVNRRESMALSPSGGTMIVYQADDTSDPIDLRLVTDLEIGNGEASEPRGPQS